jgi:hypothetical protein
MIAASTASPVRDGHLCSRRSASLDKVESPQIDDYQFDAAPDSPISQLLRQAPRHRRHRRATRTARPGVNSVRPTARETLAHEKSNALDVSD